MAHGQGSDRCARTGQDPADKEVEMIKFTGPIGRRAVLAGAAALMLATTSGAALAAEAVKVAAIFTLPVEQQWISRIHKALNAAAERGDIEYVFSENVANTDYERVMREYAEAGHQLIVGEVFGLERAARTVAEPTTPRQVS